jgi:hypothetical protein
MSESIYICRTCREKLFAALEYKSTREDGGGIHLPECEMCLKPIGEVGEGCFMPMGGLLASLHIILNRNLPMPPKPEE